VQRLAPLKSVEPFVIQIDDKSGITEVVEPITRTELGSTEALDNYFVWQYVRARETYDPMDDRRNQDVVRIMSSPDIYGFYRKLISPQTPSSPYNRLGQEGKLVCSDPVVTYLDSGDKRVAQVRFVVEEIVRSGVAFRYNKIATVEYQYVALELQRWERFINPLGFRVTSYRLDDATATGGRIQR
jgi:type IV secretion system protein VirB8